MLGDGKQSKSYREKLPELLTTLFQLEDSADLDFGIYRIMNKKRAEIEHFGSLVIRVTQPDKSCIQRVPLEVKIYALEQMFDV